MCNGAFLLYFPLTHTPLTASSAHIEKETSRISPGKNLSSAHRVLVKRTSGSIKRTDSALGSPALSQLDFLASPDSVTEVPSTFSVHTQCHAHIHTPYWKQKLLARLPGFSRTCSRPLRNLSRSDIDVVSLELSPFGQVSLAAVNPRCLIFHCCFP